MPSSQENEWEPLGFINQEVDLTETTNRMVELLDSLVASFEQMGPVVNRFGESMQAFRERNDMAVDIRHSEYPRRDGYGTYWYDSCGMHEETVHPCFTCDQPTHRLDINFHAYFCNSDECNEAVRLDLERLNGGPEARD